jgi:hypothetical protein
MKQQTGAVVKRFSFVGLHVHDGSLVGFLGSFG